MKIKLLEETLEHLNDPDMEGKSIVKENKKFFEYVGVSKIIKFITANASSSVVSSIILRCGLQSAVNVGFFNSFLIFFGAIPAINAGPLAALIGSVLTIFSVSNALAIKTKKNTTTSQKFLFAIDNVTIFLPVFYILSKHSDDIRDSFTKDDVIHSIKTEMEKASYSEKFINWIINEYTSMTRDELSESLVLLNSTIAEFLKRKKGMNKLYKQDFNKSQLWKISLELCNNLNKEFWPNKSIEEDKKEINSLIDSNNIYINEVLCKYANIILKQNKENFEEAYFDAADKLFLPLLYYLLYLEVKNIKTVMNYEMRLYPAISDTAMNNFSKYIPEENSIENLKK